MKKFLLSLFVVATSAGYVLYQYVGGTPAAADIQTAPIAQTTTTTSGNSTPPPSTATQVATTQPAKSAPVKTQPTPISAPTPAPAPAPAPKPKGQYTDGTYTGSTADAYYGYVQVEATISGGKLTNVTFLQYPNDRSTSRYINSQAMPLLKQEAIAAQSAHVSGVSGASDTSAAFIQSLGDALTQAKA